MLLLLVCVNIYCYKTLFIFQHVWYKPASYRDKNGKKIKLGRVAQGCLFDRNNNYRGPSTSAPASIAADLQSSNEAQSLVDAVTLEAGRFLQNNYQTKFSFICISVLVTTYQETKQWFRHHHGEWDDIKKRWGETSAVRLHEISRLTSVTYQKILDDYPVLRNSSGYQLVKLDFAFKHPTKCDLLFSNFATFRSCAEIVFRNEVPEQGKALLTLLNEELAEG